MALPHLPPGLRRCIAGQCETQDIHQQLWSDTAWASRSARLGHNTSLQADLTKIMIHWTEVASPEDGPRFTTPRHREGFLANTLPDPTPISAPVPRCPPYPRADQFLISQLCHSGSMKPNGALECVARSSFISVQILLRDHVDLV